MRSPSLRLKSVIIIIRIFTAYFAAKVMFLLVSVILSMGGGCYPSMHCRWYPSMPCSRSPGGAAILACIAGGIPACLAAGLQGDAIPVCIAGGIPACLAAGLQGGGCLGQRGGTCSWGVPGPMGVCSWGGCVAFCCGLLLCPCGVAFWFGGLLIEGSLLVESGLLLWPSCTGGLS